MGRTPPKISKQMLLKSNSISLAGQKLSRLRLGRKNYSLPEDSFFQRVFELEEMTVCSLC